jgi:3-mercaptopyruvate sulfurtransferase SseA
MDQTITFRRIVLIAACAGLSLACSTAHSLTGSPSQTPGATVSPVDSAASPTPQSEEDKMPRASAQEAVNLAAKGQAIILDVRSEEAYKAQHAKGAVNVPLNKIESGEHQLPKDKKIIAYCT